MVRFYLLPREGMPESVLPKYYPSVVDVDSHDARKTRRRLKSQYKAFEIIAVPI